MFTYSYTFPQVKACENVGEFKKVNPKHSQVKNKLRIIISQESWTFGIKVQLINMIQIGHISLESSWNLDAESGFVFSIWNY